MPGRLGGRRGPPRRAFVLGTLEHARAILCAARLDAFPQVEVVVVVVGKDDGGAVAGADSGGRLGVVAERIDGRGRLSGPLGAPVGALEDPGGLEGVVRPLVVGDLLEVPPHRGGGCGPAGSSGV